VRSGAAFQDRPVRRGVQDTRRLSVDEDNPRSFLDDFSGESIAQQGSEAYAATVAAKVVQSPGKFQRIFNRMTGDKVADLAAYYAGETPEGVTVEKALPSVGLPFGAMLRDMRVILGQTKMGQKIWEAGRQYKVDTQKISGTWRGTYERAVKDLSKAEKAAVTTLLDTEEDITQPGKVGDAARALRKLTNEVGQTLIDHGYLSTLRDAYLPHLFQGKYWVYSKSHPGQGTKHYSEIEALAEARDRVKAGQTDVKVFQDTFIPPDNGTMLSTKQYWRLVKMIQGQVGDQVQIHGDEDIKALMEDELLDGPTAAEISKALREGKVARPKPKLRWHGNLLERSVNNPNFVKDLDLIFQAYLYGSARKITQDKFMRDAQKSLEAMPGEHGDLKKFIEQTYIPNTLAHPTQMEKSLARVFSNSALMHWITGGKAQAWTGQDIRKILHNMNLGQYVWDMGLSGSSAIANASQVMVATSPIVGYKSIGAGYRDLMKTSSNPEMKAELEDVGVLSGISNISGEILGEGKPIDQFFEFLKKVTFTDKNRGLKSFGEGTLMPFGWVETSNRVVTYWAGKDYATRKLAKGTKAAQLAQKVVDPKSSLHDLAFEVDNEGGSKEAFARQFAFELVDKTQFRHGRENLPTGILDAGTRLLSPYKSFLLSYMKYFADTYRLGRTSGGRGVFTTKAGVQGVGRGLIGDPLKAIKFTFATLALGGAAGNPLAWGAALLLNEVLKAGFGVSGDDWLEEFKFGLTGKLGVDISGSIAVHLPTKLEDFVGRYAKILIHNGQLAYDWMRDQDTLMQARRNTRELLPAVGQRGQDVKRILQTGQYISPNRRTPIEIEESKISASVKRMFGILPSGVRQAYDKSRDLQTRKRDLRDKSADLSERWANAIHKGDQEGAQDVIDGAISKRQKAMDRIRKLREGSKDATLLREAREEALFYKQWIQNREGRRAALRRLRQTLQERDRRLKGSPRYIRLPELLKRAGK
jgi:hypothetical protein